MDRPSSSTETPTREPGAPQRRSGYSWAEAHGEVSGRPNTPATPAAKSERRMDHLLALLRARRRAYSGLLGGGSGGGGGGGAGRPGVGLDVDGHRHVVAQHGPAGVQGLVPDDPVVLPVEGEVRLEARLL